jgi:hypothetical protein
MFGLTASADQSAVAELVWSEGVILDVISLLSWIFFWISAGSLSTVLLVVAGVVSVSVVGTVGASLSSVSAVSPERMPTLAPGELSV